MGEGIGNDSEIIPWVSSVNISCGYHAGNIETIMQTVLLAKKYNVAIGAHPSFPDKENFGRSEMHLPAEEIYEIISLQVQLFLEITRVAEIKLHHIKPHGGLYNMAAKEPQIAKTIALAVKDTDPDLILYGLSGSHLISEAKAIGLKTANEVFADRTYRDDGSLTPRNEPGALIEDPDTAVRQVLQMVKAGVVTTVSGKQIPIVAETICVHGDGKHAAKFARSVYEELKKENISVRPMQ